MAKSKGKAARRLTPFILHLVIFGAGIIVGFSYLATSKSQTDLTTKDRQPTNNSPIATFLHGEKLISKPGSEDGMQSLYLEKKKNFADEESPIDSIHLLDLGLCSYPQIAVDEGEMNHKFILNANGCGDGQSYYIISLDEPYTAEKLTLPYNYIEGYRSTPIGWLNDSSIVFVKIYWATSGDKREELYITDLNSPTVYKKISTSN